MKLKFIHKAKRIFITISSLSIIAAISIAVASSASAATHFTSYTPKIKYNNGNIDYCYYVDGSKNVNLTAGEYFVNGKSSCSAHSVISPEASTVDVLTVVINAMGLQHLCIKVYLLKIYLNQNVMILVGEATTMIIYS